MKTVSPTLGIGWRVPIAALTLVALFPALSGHSSAGGNPPAPPTNLEALPLADGLLITLRWEDNADNEEHVIVERSSTGSEGPWGVAALLPTDTTTYNDGGLSDNVTYWYRVATVNVNGTSGYSNVAFGTASAFPAPPPGNADCNGSVTATDAEVILQLVAGLIDSLPCMQYADVDLDGTVDAIDASLVLQYVAGLIDSFEPPRPESGVRGLVTIGPICPVKREDIPCPDPPFGAKIVVEDEDGMQVATVMSGDDGMFEVGLDPGSYVLIPQSPNDAGPPFASPQPVDVLSGEFTEVLIQYDSGIR